MRCTFTFGNQLAPEPLGRGAAGNFKAYIADPDNRGFAYTLREPRSPAPAPQALEYYQRAISLGEKRGAGFDLTSVAPVPPSSRSKAAPQMNRPQPQAKRHLGQILIDQGILTEDPAAHCAARADQEPCAVGRLLVQLGFVSEATLRDALSEKLGLQAVDLSRIIVDPAALKLVPRDMARRYRIFPVALDRGQKKFIVALADTNNIVALDQCARS